jgi:hypothetical protein
MWASKSFSWTSVEIRKCFIYKVSAEKIQQRKLQDKSYDKEVAITHVSLHVPFAQLNCQLMVKSE